MLLSSADLPHAVHEIYRWLRAGHKVIAVVSAFAGETDRLLAEAALYGRISGHDAVARLVATGEETTAALLTLELDRFGVPATVLDPSQVEFILDDDLDEPEPSSVNTDAIFTALNRCKVIVVPGFFARTKSGNVSLLGRGGSDLTAVYLAQQLRARCRLIKDVDGFYDADPATNEAASRFDHMTWEEACGIGGRIVQPQTIDFARRTGFSFEIAALNQKHATVISRGPSRLACAERLVAPVKIGLLGLGTVGLGVFRQLNRYPELFDVTGIAVRHPDRHRRHAPSHLLTTNCWDVLECADVVVELIGGEDPAATLIEAALYGGKDVVTANKLVIAKHGDRLKSVTKDIANIKFAAAVGGAVPALEAVHRMQSEEEVLEISGVLNGTTNFILDQIASGRTFAEAVAEAQILGFAEADPSSDLQGLDTAWKIILLSQTAFGVQLTMDDIECTGIDKCGEEWVRSLADQGRCVRLIGRALRAQDKIIATVRPEIFKLEHPFAQTRDEFNTVIVQSRNNSTVLRGRGAGRWPTTVSVMADLFDLARERADVQLQERPLQINAGALTAGGVA